MISPQSALFISMQRWTKQSNHDDFTAECFIHFHAALDKAAKS